jgi:hypothetical protein
VSLVLDSSATLAWIYAQETTDAARRIFEIVAENGAVGLRRRIAPTVLFRTLEGCVPTCRLVEHRAQQERLGRLAP